MCLFGKKTVIEQPAAFSVYISLIIVGTFLVSSGAFFGVNLFLSILDLTGFPQRLVKYKIQKDKNCPVGR